MTYDAGLRVGRPAVLFEDRFRREQRGNSEANYDVSLDGRRFLMVLDTSPSAGESGRIEPQMVLLQHWTEAAGVPSGVR